MQELDDKFVESEQNLGAARLRIKLLDTTLQVGGGEQNLGAARLRIKQLDTVLQGEGRVKMKKKFFEVGTIDVAREKINSKISAPYIYDGVKLVISYLD